MSIANSKARTVVGQNLAHESAKLHVTGHADYADDLPEPAGCLHAALALGPDKPGTFQILTSRMPQEAWIFTATDIPGENNAGPVVHDEPLLPTQETNFPQQPIALVVAEDRITARRLARRVRLESQAKSAPVSLEQAIQANTRLHEDLVIETGDWQSALDAASQTVEGSIAIGGQEHFYLEGQVALAIPSSDGLHIISSTQHPTEIQDLAAHLLSLSAAEVSVEVRRMGGGFGGKESQAAHIALLAALAAHHTGRAVKLNLDRDDDMIITGKRHDFRADYKVAHDAQGIIQAFDIDLASRCGWSEDLSRAVNDRAAFHADNAYFSPAHRITSRRYRTGTVSNTAFRGFGGPQGMVPIERALDKVAASLDLDPLDVRLANLYGQQGSTTPYGMEIKERVLEPMLRQLAESSEYRKRRAEIQSFNASAPRFRKGISLMPIKFGISFTASFLNQAGALVNIYKDGSILLNHGGTEMGQGLFQKVAQVVATGLGVKLEQIKVCATRTDKVPNTSPTAASSGSDLNGMAALNAVKQLKDRLTKHLQQKFDTDALPQFRDGHITIGWHQLSFAEAANSAWFARVPLSATGHYATPGIGWDPKTGKGRPFFYFAHGAACSEVEIDTLTGMNRVVRADILHDAGQSLNPAIDLGQIEGGYIQGMGWLTMEELVYSKHGKLQTHAPSTYKIPCASDRPDIMNIALYDGKNPEATVYRSKAVGEPPFMLGLSVHSALADAIAGLGPKGWWPDLDAPATAEQVLSCLTSLPKA